MQDSLCLSCVYCNLIETDKKRFAHCKILNFSCFYKLRHEVDANGYNVQLKKVNSWPVLVCSDYKVRA